MPLTLNVLSVNRPNADGIMTRISTAADGTEANNYNFFAQASDDGHYVVFFSYARNLGGGPVNAGGNLFRKNVQTGAIELISVGHDGTAANSSSEYFRASA